MVKSFRIAVSNTLQSSSVLLSGLGQIKRPLYKGFLLLMAVTPSFSSSLSLNTLLKCLLMVKCLLQKPDTVSISIREAFTKTAGNSCDRAPYWVTSCMIHDFCQQDLTEITSAPTQFRASLEHSLSPAGSPHTRSSSEILASAWQAGGYPHRN